MLTRQEKESQVEGLKAIIDGANSLLLVDYRGLTVSDANELRSKLREAGGGIRYRVAKNSLVKRAVAGTPIEPIDSLLVGPIALAIAYEEPEALAKALVDYSKDNEKFEIKGGVIEGEVVDLEMIRALAALPTKHELQGMLAGTLQAPLRNLAGTLHSLLGHVRNALEQRQSQLEAQ
jgi:large subunit ribosomal protein L10